MAEPFDSLPMWRDPFGMQYLQDLQPIAEIFDSQADIHPEITKTSVLYDSQLYEINFAHLDSLEGFLLRLK